MAMQGLGFSCSGLTDAQMREIQEMTRRGLIVGFDSGSGPIDDFDGKNVLNVTWDGSSYVSNTNYDVIQILTYLVTNGIA